jgi:hypothetical protein
LRLCDCRQSDAPADAPREIAMSQQEIAAMANLSRDMANQVLGRLTQQKLIDSRYRSNRRDRSGGIAQDCQWRTRLATSASGKKLTRFGRS